MENSIPEMSQILHALDLDQAEAGVLAWRRLTGIVDTGAGEDVMLSKGLDDAVQCLLIAAGAALRQRFDDPGWMPLVLATVHRRPEGGEALLFKPSRHGKQFACRLAVSRVDLKDTVDPASNRRTFRGEPHTGISGLVFKSGQICASRGAVGAGCPAYIDVKRRLPDEPPTRRGGTIAIPIFEPWPESLVALRADPLTALLPGRDPAGLHCLCPHAQRCQPGQELAAFEAPSLANEPARTGPRMLGVLNIVFDSAMMDQRFSQDLPGLVRQVCETLDPLLILSSRLLQQRVAKRTMRKATRVIHRSLELVRRAIDPRKAAVLALWQLASGWQRCSMSLHLRDDLLGQDSDSNTLQIAAVAGEHGRGFLLGTEYPPNKGLVGLAFAQQRAVHSCGQDLSHRRERGQDDYHHLFPGTEANLALPLTLDGEVLGVLNLESPDQAAFGLGNGSFDRDEIEQAGHLDLRCFQLAADYLALLCHSFYRGSRLPPARTGHRAGIARFVSECPVTREFLRGDQPADAPPRSWKQVLNELLNAALTGQVFEGTDLWGSASRAKDDHLNIVGHYGHGWEKFEPLPINETSVTGTAAHRLQPIYGKIVGRKLITRDGEQIAYREHKPGLKSELAVPYAFGGQVQGVIATASDNVATYSKDPGERRSRTFGEWARVASLLVGLMTRYELLSQSKRQFRDFVGLVIHFTTNAVISEDGLSRLLLTTLREAIPVQDMAVLHRTLAYNHDGTIKHGPDGDIDYDWETYLGGDSVGELSAAGSVPLCNKLYDRWKEGKKWCYSQDRRTAAVALHQDGELRGALLLRSDQSLDTDGRRETIESWATIVTPVMAHHWEQMWREPTPRVTAGAWLEELAAWPKDESVDQMLTSAAATLAGSDAVDRCLVYRRRVRPEGVARLVALAPELDHHERQDQERLWEIEVQPDDSGLVAEVFKRGAAGDQPPPQVLRCAAIRKSQETSGSKRREQIEYFGAGARRQRPLAYIGVPIRAADGAVFAVLELFRERRSIKDGWDFNQEEEREVMRFAERLGQHIDQGQLWDYPFDRLGAEFTADQAKCFKLMSSQDNAFKRKRLPSQQGPFLVGKSAVIRSLVAEIREVALELHPVLIIGDTGSGKEIVAQLLAKQSARKPELLSFNCGAISETLAEAELFGHTAGAFTGAGDKRNGLFQEADGGTIFLDEVDSLSPAIQAKLLRVIENDGRIRPVGADHEQAVNVRVVSATWNYDKLVDRKEFRPDLLARLRRIPLRLPPLKERAEDIPILLHWLQALHGTRFLGIRVEALALLRAHPWEHNVRELESLLWWCWRNKKDQRWLTAQLVWQGLQEIQLKQPPGLTPPQPATVDLGDQADMERRRQFDEDLAWLRLHQGKKTPSDEIVLERAERVRRQLLQLQKKELAQLVGCDSGSLRNWLKAAQKLTR